MATESSRQGEGQGRQRLGQGLEPSQGRGRVRVRVSSHLKLRTGRPGLSQVPRKQHDMLIVVAFCQKPHIWLKVCRQRLPTPRHARQLPTDEAAATSDKGHDLDNGTQRIGSALGI